MEDPRTSSEASTQPAERFATDEVEGTEQDAVDDGFGNDDEEEEEDE